MKYKVRIICDDKTKTVKIIQQSVGSAAITRLPYHDAMVLTQALLGKRYEDKLMDIDKSILDTELMKDLKQDDKDKFKCTFCKANTYNEDVDKLTFGGNNHKKCQAAADKAVYEELSRWGDEGGIQR